MIDFRLSRTTAAPRETVFDRLTDHAAYADMTPLRASELVREGSPEANGVGAQRKLTLVGPPLVEEVTTYDRPGHFAYKLIGGLPVRDHVGDVHLTTTPAGGTRIDYHVVSTPALPLGLGVVAQPVLGLVLKQAITGLLDGVIRAAEKSHDLP